jgi:hypothetical protein
VAGCVLSVVVTNDPPIGRYTIVDYASTNGFLAGAFAATNGLLKRWRIEDTGRALVLVHLPPPGTVMGVR